VLLNKEADRTILHSVLEMYKCVLASQYMLVDISMVLESVGMWRYKTSSHMVIDNTLTRS